MAIEPQPTTNAQTILAQAFEGESEILGNLGVTSDSVNSHAAYISSRMGGDLSSPTINHQRAAATIEFIESDVKTAIEGESQSLSSKAERDLLQTNSIAAFERAAKAYYDNSPNLDNFMETPPFSAAITPLESDLITQALDDTPLAVRQTTFSMLKDVVDRVPNLSLDDTIETIGRGMMGYANTKSDSLLSNPNASDESLLFLRRLSALALENKGFVPEYRYGEATQQLREENAALNPPYPDGENPALLRAQAQNIEREQVEANDQLLDPLGLDEFAEVDDQPIINPEDSLTTQDSLNAQYNNQEGNIPMPPPLDDNFYAAQEQGYMNDAPIDDEGLPMINDEILPLDEAANEAVNPAPPAPQSVSNPNVSDVDLLNHQIEKNPYYSGGHIDRGAIEERLNNTYEKLVDIGASDDMKIGILHQELADETIKIRDANLSKEGLTSQDRLKEIKDASTALNIASATHLKASSNSSGFFSASRTPYHGIANDDQIEILKKSLRGVTQGARQYVYAEMDTAKASNPNFGFEDAVDSIKKSLGDFDDVSKKVSPNPSNELHKFNTTYASLTNKKDNTAAPSPLSDTAEKAPAATNSTTTNTPDDVVLPPTPNHEAEALAAAAINSEQTPSQSNSNAGAGNPKPSQNNSNNDGREPDREIPDPDNPNQSNDNNKNDQQRTIVSGGGGGGTSYTLFGGSTFNTADHPHHPANVAASKEAASKENADTNKTARSISAPIRDFINGRIRPKQNSTPQPEASNSPQQLEQQEQQAVPTSDNTTPAPSPVEATPNERTDTITTVPDSTESVMNRARELDAQDEKNLQADDKTLEASQQAKNEAQAQAQQAHQQAVDQVNLQRDNLAATSESSESSLDDVEASSDVDVANTSNNDKASSKEGNKKSKDDGLSDDQLVAQGLAGGVADLARQTFSAVVKQANETNVADSNVSPQEAAAKASDMAEANNEVNAATPEVNPQQDAVNDNKSPAVPNQSDDSTQTQKPAAPKPATNNGNNTAAEPAATQHFNDAFADSIHNGMKSHHESLMKKYADPETSAEELYSETEKFLENQEQLSKQARSLAKANAGNEDYLNSLADGLRESGKMSEDIYKKADEKGLLDPEHPLNVEAAEKAGKGKDNKNGLADKFSKATEGLQEAMTAAAEAAAKAVNAIASVLTRKGGK